MSIISALIALIRRRKKTEALEAPKNKTIKALQAEEQTFQIPLESVGVGVSAHGSVSEGYHEPPIEEETLKLGLAAGYTGRSIRSIEDSLERIEMNMISKDWLKAHEDDKSGLVIQTLESIRNLLKNHETTEQKRFEAIINSISRLKTVSQSIPEPFKAEINKEIGILEKNISLSPQMERVLAIVKETGEISYEELRQKLGISLSALRGMLTNMAMRTNKTERFTKENKGWLRYRGD